MKKKKTRIYNPAPPTGSSASEPGLITQDTARIRFFTSFREMNEGDAVEIATFSGEEHLQHATALIMRVYEQQLRKKEGRRRIYFK